MGRYDSPSMKLLMEEADEIWLVNSWQNWVIDLMPETLENLSAEFDAKIKVFGTKHFGEISPNKILSIDSSRRHLYRQPSSKEVISINKKLKGIIPSDFFVDLSLVSCGGDVQKCVIFTKDGLLVSSDGGHLTKAGARHLSGDFLKLRNLSLPTPLN